MDGKELKKMTAIVKKLLATESEGPSLLFWDGIAYNEKTASPIIEMASEQFDSIVNRHEGICKT